MYEIFLLPHQCYADNRNKVKFGKIVQHLQYSNISSHNVDNDQQNQPINFEKVYLN